MHNKGKNSSSGPAYSARPTTPSRSSTLFLNEACRRKEAHVVSSRTVSTSPALSTSALKSSRQISPQWTAQSMGSRIKRFCTSAANEGASGETSPLNFTPRLLRRLEDVGAGTSLFFAKSRASSGGEVSKT
jgi:hypothetical protein